MNKLLPKIEELKPINDSRLTFSETPLTKDFNLLDFKNKLQVINDIVRETMIFDKYPDPSNEIETLIGDTYTASLASIDYLKSIGLGTNYRCVIAQRRKFDPIDLPTTHIVVLVDDDSGNTYQFDCSPMAGYKCGRVEAINKERFYENYVEIKGDIATFIGEIRKLTFQIKNGNYDNELVYRFFQILEDAKSHEILAGFRFEGYTLLSQISKNKIEQARFLESANSCNPYFKKADSILYRNKLLERQISFWKEELQDLIPTDQDYERQLELAQNIVQALKILNSSYERYLNIDGKNIEFSYISPRLFYELGLNVVLLKPSSFKLGVTATIKERFLDKGAGAIAGYYSNIGQPTELTGIKPMRMFHPHGYKYERSMTGPCYAFLIKEDAQELLMTKHVLRKELGKNIANHNVMWYDGKEIVWDPIITNLVHTTDDACEASMHYLSAYPEYQLMNRFMYPNPRLRKVVKR